MHKYFILPGSAGPRSGFGRRSGCRSERLQQLDSLALRYSLRINRSGPPVHLPSLVHRPTPPSAELAREATFADKIPLGSQANQRQTTADEDTTSFLPPCLSEAISEAGEEAVEIGADEARAALIVVVEAAAKQRAARRRKKIFST